MADVWMVVVGEDFFGVELINAQVWQSGVEPVETDAQISPESGATHEDRRFKVAAPQQCLSLGRTGEWWRLAFG